MVSLILVNVDYNFHSFNNRVLHARLIILFFLVFTVESEEDKNSSPKMDLIRYVKKWSKFNELIVILNASLREIEDRWAGGKGPLAIDFSVEEVKKLIRALFQNTDRRAATLSRIKFES